MVFTIYKKCFCFNLYTAGIIIGWLAAAQSLISIVTSAVMLDNVDVFVNKTISENSTTPEETKYFYQSALSMSIAWNTIEVFAAIMLLVGIMKGKRLMLLPWLINNFVLLLMAVTIYVVVVVVGFTASAGLGFMFLIVGFFIVWFNGYIWVAMHSLYKVMGMDDTSRMNLLGHRTPNYSTYVSVD